MCHNLYWVSSTIEVVLISWKSVISVTFRFTKKRSVNWFVNDFRESSEGNKANCKQPSSNEIVIICSDSSSTMPLLYRKIIIQKVYDLIIIIIIVFINALLLSFDLKHDQ